MCSVKFMVFFFFELLYSAFLFVSGIELKIRLEFYPLRMIHFSTADV